MAEEILYQAFTATGVANTTVKDGGITSTDTEKKKLISILVNVTGHAGNFVQGWLEREKKVDLYDYLVDNQEASGTNMYKSVTKIVEIPLNLLIPVGQTFKAAIKSGATNKNLFGAYKYQIV